LELASIWNFGLRNCPRTAGKLEAAIGFEPMNEGFADLCLSHLATPPLACNEMKKDEGVSRELQNVHRTITQNSELQALYTEQGLNGTNMRDIKVKQA
jgi:hypothetical protein